MPYITSERRAILDESFSLWNRLRIQKINTEGELNYVISTIVARYVDEQKLAYAEGFGYKNLNAIMGVLDHVAHEFKRRVVDLYEDKKIKENGDIYA